MKHENLNTSNVDDLDARLRRLETASPVRSASVGAGGIRLYDGGRLTIDGIETSIYLEVREEQGFIVFATEGSSARLADPSIWSHDLGMVLAGPRTSSSTAGVGFAGSRLDLGDTTAIFRAGDRANKGVDFHAAQTGFWDIGGDTNQGLAHMVGYPDGAWDAGGSRAEGLASAYGGADGGWGIGNETAYVITGPDGPVQVVGGMDVFGTKNFVMPHPTKDGHLLRHGATESPVSGTEYTGRATLDFDGAAIVTLPDYFESLNKEGGRTVQVTAVGHPFPVGASDVIDGQLTVYGNPGQSVFWTVKAERRGADFPTESPGDIAEPPAVPTPAPAP